MFFFFFFFFSVVQQKNVLTSWSTRKGKDNKNDALEKEMPLVDKEESVTKELDEDESIPEKEKLIAMVKPDDSDDELFLSAEEEPEPEDIEDLTIELENS